MRDGHSVARYRGYVVSAPSEELLADTVLCKCSDLRWEGVFLCCQSCGTCYGRMDEVPVLRPSAVKRRSD